MDNILVWIIVLVIAILMLFGLTSFHFNTDANGTHTGIVTAVEQNGIIYKNYHVYFKTNSTSSQEDNYCVPQNDTELVDQLRKAQESQKEVILHYTGVIGFGYNLCRYDQVTSIDQLKGGE